MLTAMAPTAVRPMWAERAKKVMSVGIVGLDVSDEWRVTQGREIRCEDKKLLRECLASGLRLTHWWVAWITSQKRRDCRTPRALEGTEEFVEFVGGVEIGF